MFVPRARGALLRSSLAVAASAAAALAGPGAAGAASTPAPPPPTSTAACYGSVTPATPTVDDPNLLDYSFHCDSRITAYTILVNRYRHNWDTIDDFETGAQVLQPDGVTPDSNVAWTCEGQIPSDGFNCNTGSPTAFMGAWSFAEGSFDTTDPYCGIQPRANGTSTTAAAGEAAAVVQLVVSDSSGAEDGPFTLPSTVACPKPKPKARHHRGHGHKHTH